MHLAQVLLIYLDAQDPEMDPSDPLHFIKVTTSLISQSPRSYTNYLSATSSSMLAYPASLTHKQGFEVDSLGATSLYGVCLDRVQVLGQY